MSNIILFGGEIADMKKIVIATLITSIFTINLAQVQAESAEPTTIQTYTNVPNAPENVALTSIADMVDYSYGATTFSNYVWVNKGNTFNGTFAYFDAEVASGRASFDIEYYNSKGELQYTDKIRDAANWVTNSSDPVGMKNFKIRLVNKGKDSVKLKWGNVGYYPL